MTAVSIRKDYRSVYYCRTYYKSRMDSSSESSDVQYSVFSNCSTMVTVSPSGPRKLFKGVTTATSGVLARFPWLLPVRNPVAGYGASAVTRTPDRGHVAEVKNQFHGVAGSQSGFPKKPFSPLMSTCAVSSKHKNAEHRPHVT
jgi:hypothetical protein